MKVNGPGRKTLDKEESPSRGRSLHVYTLTYSMLYVCPSLIILMISVDVKQRLKKKKLWGGGTFVSSGFSTEGP